MRRRRRWEETALTEHNFGGLHQCLRDQPMAHNEIIREALFCQEWLEFENTGRPEGTDYRVDNHRQRYQACCTIDAVGPHPENL